MSGNNANQPTSKSSTLASIKSSFIAKVNHATVRRQRSSVDTCVSDVTSAPSDGPSADIMMEVAVGRRAEGRGSAPAQSGVHRRRIRSPFSLSRLVSEPNKPSRSSLAEQRIIESVVFRPSTTSSSGRSSVHQLRDVGDCQATKPDGGGQRQTADVDADVEVECQRVPVVKRSLSQDQCHDHARQMSSSSTLVRSVSTNNTREPLLLFVNGNFSKLP